jgi:hypothetical protein
MTESYGISDDDFFLFFGGHLQHSNHGRIRPEQSTAVQIAPDRCARKWAIPLQNLMQAALRIQAVIAGIQEEVQRDGIYCDLNHCDRVKQQLNCFSNTNSLVADRHTGYVRLWVPNPQNNYLSGPTKS